MEPPFPNLTHPHRLLPPCLTPRREAGISTGISCRLRASLHPHPLEPGAHPPRPGVRPAGPNVRPRPSAEGFPLRPGIPSLPAPRFPSRAQAGPLLSMTLLDTESRASSCEDGREGREARGWVSPSCSLQEATCHPSPSESTEGPVSLNPQLSISSNHPLIKTEVLVWSLEKTT